LGTEDIILIIFYRSEMYQFTMIKLYTGITLKFSFDYRVRRKKVYERVLSVCLSLLASSHLVQTWSTDPSCVWTIKRPPSGRGLGHVTKFRNFRTPLITGKTSKVNYRYINNNKTANIKGKN